ncbi:MULTISPECIES: spore germination protein [Peribacillus]|uniref:spore germination protein n=1 Tax=Peribacillus TaxID=2675229 RepID=UPI001F4E6532|nr:MULTISPECIES: spore germination protein [unclassified Peribacillus]MCK1982535.1 spore germination protein [Peribacillus sp. Aquil_B1]MCK2008044.1 spore germination protein [Peribacillus sp. Aquil_B8]
MKSRVPIPLRKLIEDKQSVKSKKQEADLKQSKNPNSSKTKNQNQKPVQAQNRNKDSKKHETKLISSDLQFNLDHIKKMVGNSSDIVIRDFQAGKNGQIKLGVVYTDGLTDSASIQDFILDTLMVEIRNSELDVAVLNHTDCFEMIKSHILPVGGIVEINDFQKLFNHVLSGDTMLLMDGSPKGMALGSRDWADRGVQEPSSQTVVRGPKDGFTETLRTNTALIRRRIKDPNLWLETKQIGEKTQTDVAIMYLKGVADDKTVSELQSRLNRINIDAILESGYIEELIQDEVYTPFPTVYNTERPDAVSAAILEGRIAILIDGTPFVLIVPALMVHFFQSSEDYYQRADIATLIRVLRYLSFFLALLTPSLYIAVSTFHQEMLPTPLLISLASQREGVPFPAFVEAMLMEVVFEILREAGVRMPRAIGSSISIVGALVIGQAAVEAGFVSATMVIIVSLTAICSFVFPANSMAMAFRMLRFLFMILAATFGLYGIILGLIVMVLHLSSIRSFGLPYLAPNAPFILQDQKDNIIRMPHWSLLKRPRLISKNDTDRGEVSSPKPPR